jgi:hypothetical protein
MNTVLRTYEILAQSWLVRWVPLQARGEFRRLIVSSGKKPKTGTSSWETLRSGLALNLPGRRPSQRRPKSLGAMQ